MKEFKSSETLENLFEEWKKAHSDESDKDYLMYQGGNVPKYAFLPDGIIDENQFAHKKKIGKSLLFIAKEAYWYSENYDEEKYKKALKNPMFWHREVSMGNPDVSQTMFSRRLSMLANAFHNNDYEKVDKNHDNLQSTAVINLNKRGGFAYCKWETLEGYVASYCKYIEREIAIINPDVIVCCGAGVKWLLDKYVCIDKGIKVVSVYHPSYFALSDEAYLDQFECALEGKEWKLRTGHGSKSQATEPMKGIIFDTNKTVLETATFDMLTSEKISAYGDASRYIDSFNIGDIAFFYVKGKGIVAAGEICSETKTCSYYGYTEKYRTVKMISPVTIPAEEKELKYIKPKRIRELLGIKDFFWASTIKVPYLRSKEECNFLISELRRINNEEESCMDKFTEEILKKLKAQYEKLFGAKPYKKSEGNQAYWLNEYLDNIYERQMDKVAETAYREGAGNEITTGKIGALKSSSALTYNTFHNGIAEVVDDKNRFGIGKGVYKVEFEKKQETLKSSISRSHMDAFLYCDKTGQAVACEMKMTEWLFNAPGNLSISYLDSGNYKEKEGVGKRAGEVFSAVAEKMISRKVTVKVKKKDKESEREEYKSIFSRYDAFQMFKHALACYNSCVFDEPGKIKKLTLVNCAWTLPESQMLQGKLGEKYMKAELTERIEFEIFNKIMQPVKELFSENGIDFDIKFITYSEFLGLFKKTQEELDYLKRYTF